MLFASTIFNKRLHYYKYLCEEINHEYEINIPNILDDKGSIKYINKKIRDLFIYIFIFIYIKLKLYLFIYINIIQII